ncbi:MAG: hypothetical protein QNJ12_09085 [Ilumatobacter sp.]|uniref:hypothetical protein n=1 Tax=Ilumatobacter sp. TaxID=1967498 RepID=UPI0026391678|nr:hypothetical protein [Ilumatobacter sp.]MDJ0768936.1 hypothetical protein [Ilumatobacter sp.]
MRRLLALVSATLVAATTAVFVSPGAQPAAAAAGYEPLPAPQRLLDTRAGGPTVDGALSGIGKRPARSVLQLAVAGRAGLPAPVGSVVLNVTVDQPEGAGFVTVWPCDEPQPNTSNLNHVGGQTVAAAVLTRVADDGTVCLFTLAGSHLIADVAGEFPAGTFEALAAPERLADTRPGEATVDGRFVGAGRRGAGTTYEIRVAGRGSVPPDATAVALNVTATDIGAHGFLTVFPCDAPRPNASNVNYSPGLTTPNAVMTRLDPDGDVCVYTLAPVHLVVDIAGVLPDTVFRPLPAPTRLLDTRDGEPTADGGFAGGGIQPDGASLQLDVAGRAGIPADAAAVVLNVTSTGSSLPGFVTSHPQGSTLPGSSNLNFTAGRTTANLVIAALGPDGDICLFNRNPTHLVVDIAGWLTGPAPSGSDAGCPARAADASAAQYRNAHVRRPDLHRAVGTDRIAVYVCEIPVDSNVFDGSQQHTTTSQDFAAFAQAELEPYFDELSGGRYDVVFTARGNVSVGRNGDPLDCLDAASELTGAPYTNVLVAGTTLDGGGFAGPGTIFTGSGAPDVAVLDWAPNQSSRGSWLGGATISVRPNPGVIAHEIGHTLHWPHSYIGPDDEYDNPVDVMSDGMGWCRVGNVSYPCIPGNTLAFNRLASDWLGDGQMVTHPSGTANYVLERPNGDGLQLVALPDPAQPLSLLTVEAKPAVGNDDFLASEGVAIHVVDQLDRTGGLSGLSTARIQRQALGAPYGFEHVVDVGESVTVHGVTVTVLRHVGDGYEVTIRGSYSPPGASFFAESLLRGRDTCADDDPVVAMATGCVR